MLNTTRSLATTLALAAALLAGSGVYNVTFAETKAEKAREAEKKSDASMQDELSKLLNDMLDKDGPGGLIGQIGAGDRDRVDDALKKAGDDEYAKHVKSLEDYFKKHFEGRYDPASRILVIANADLIKRFEYNDKQYVSVTIPANENGPEAELRFQQNGDNYRLQLDNNLTGDELARRIKAALAKADANKEKFADREHVGLQMIGTLLLSTLDYDAQHTRAPERKKK